MEWTLTKLQSNPLSACYLERQMQHCLGLEVQKKDLSIVSDQPTVLRTG